MADRRSQCFGGGCYCTGEESSSVFVRCEWKICWLQCTLMWWRCACNGCHMLSMYLIYKMAFRLLRDYTAVIIQKAFKYKSSGNLLASPHALIFLPSIASHFARWQILWNLPKPLVGLSKAAFTARWFPAALTTCVCCLLAASLSRKVWLTCSGQRRETFLHLLVS